MRPVQFAYEAVLPLTPNEIVERILDASQWTSFRGSWPVPAIASAEYELRTAYVVGSRIRVRNTDGSSHVEEIVAWEPDRRLRLRMQEFTPPLSRLAERFDETWTFEPIGAETKVVRSFELWPTTRLARLVLWSISIFLRRAVARHLRDIRCQMIAEHARIGCQ